MTSKIEIKMDYHPLPFSFKAEEHNREIEDVQKKALDSWRTHEVSSLQEHKILPAPFSFWRWLIDLFKRCFGCKKKEEIYAETLDQEIFSLFVEIKNSSPFIEQINNGLGDSNALLLGLKEALRLKVAEREFAGGGRTTKRMAQLNRWFEEFFRRRENLMKEGLEEHLDLLKVRKDPEPPFHLDFEIPAFQQNHEEGEDSFGLSNKISRMLTSYEKKWLETAPQRKHLLAFEELFGVDCEVPQERFEELAVDLLPFARLEAEKQNEIVEMDRFQLAVILNKIYQTQIRLEFEKEKQKCAAFVDALKQEAVALLKVSLHYYIGEYALYHQPLSKENISDGIGSVLVEVRKLVIEQLYQRYPDAKTLQLESLDELSEGACLTMACSFLSSFDLERVEGGETKIEQWNECATAHVSRRLQANVNEGLPASLKGLLDGKVESSMKEVALVEEYPNKAERVYRVVKRLLSPREWEFFAVKVRQEVVNRCEFFILKGLKLALSGSEKLQHLVGEVVRGAEMAALNRGRELLKEAKEVFREREKPIQRQELESWADGLIRKWVSKVANRFGGENEMLSLDRSRLLDDVQIDLERNLGGPRDRFLKKHPNLIRSLYQEVNEEDFGYFKKRALVILKHESE